MKKNLINFREYFLIFTLFVFVTGRLSGQDKYKYEIQIGGNYSEYTTVKSQGHWGPNISFNRNYFLLDYLNMKTGITFTTKYMDILNVIKYNPVNKDNSYYYLSWVNKIETEKNILEFNLISEITIFQNHFSRISMILGLGETINYSSPNIFNIDSTLIFTSEKDIMK